MKPLCISFRRLRALVGKKHSRLRVHAKPPIGAPILKVGGLDVHKDGANAALFLHFPELFGRNEPFLEGGGKIYAVFKEFAQPVEIFTVIPGNAHLSDRLVLHVNPF